MRLSAQLAYKNLINAGLRTWLNTGVLSLAFVIILFYKGLIDGWAHGAAHNSIEWEFTQGQLHHSGYESNNMITIQDAHGIVTNYQQQNLTPILIRQATIYPNGRLVNTLLKGIDAKQKKVKIPTHVFSKTQSKYPAVIGKRMAKTAQLNIGDQVLMRWRDENGTFDADYITIVAIFDTSVASVDQGQIWVPIEVLWEITGLHGEATLYLVDNAEEILHNSDWEYLSQDELLRKIMALIEVESISASIIYSILLCMALLAIFDTQVLSIFRRQREIGTYMALGMSHRQVVLLFTMEGAMYSIFAMLIGSLIGIPLLLYVSQTGISFGEVMDDMGVSSAETIYPMFSTYSLISTIILIVGSTTIVSFIPARKITKMNPILALKGKQH